MTTATPDGLLDSIVDQLYSPTEHDNNHASSKRDLFDRILARCTAFKDEFLAHFGEEVVINKTNGRAVFVKRSGTASARAISELRKVERACMRAAEAISMVSDDMAWLPDGKLEIRGGEYHILMGSTQLFGLLVRISKLASVRPKIYKTLKYID